MQRSILAGLRAVSVQGIGLFRSAMRKTPTAPGLRARATESLTCSVSARVHSRRMYLWVGLDDRPMQIPIRSMAVVRPLDLLPSRLFGACPRPPLTLPCAGRASTTSHRGPLFIHARF